MLTTVPVDLLFMPTIKGRSDHKKRFKNAFNYLYFSFLSI